MSAVVVPVRREQAMTHAELDFADHAQVVVEQQVEGLVDRTGQRILDRQQAHRGPALFDGGEDVLEAVAGQRVDLRAEVLEDRLLRVRARLALIGDRDGAAAVDADRSARGRDGGGLRLEIVFVHVQVGAQLDGVAQINVVDGEGWAVGVPVEQDPDAVGDAVGDGDLGGAEQRHVMPADLAGRQGGVHGGQVVGCREDGAGEIGDIEIVGGDHGAQQFLRRFDDCRFGVCRRRSCAADASGGHDSS